MGQELDAEHDLTPDTGDVIDGCIILPVGAWSKPTPTLNVGTRSRIVKTTNPTSGPGRFVAAAQRNSSPSDPSSDRQEAEQTCGVA